jgi:membrane fusion protein (multidrug efflux system)
VLLSEAELDAAEKEADRVAALKSLVEVLQELEETAKARKANAEGSEAPVLKIKARRLEAEVRLERAQAKAEGQATSAGPEHEKVVVATAQAKDVVVTESFIGQIRSRRHIEVRSLENGYLEEVLVKEGQAVKKGDMMFKIVPLLYQAKLDAELAEVEVATLNLKTTEKLFEKKYTSADEVALAKAKLAGAKAKAAAARAELDLTMVRAPFDGIVDRLQQTQGSLVTEADVLTTLSDNSEMWVYFDVPQSNYLEYVTSRAKDEEVAAELVLAAGRIFPQPGKIAAVQAQFDQEAGTIAFRADFPNPEGLLRHGMTGNVMIHRTLKKAIVIPQRATFEALDKRCVYVVDKENVAHRREVVVQNELADDFVIQKGQDVNSRIVVEGVREIQDGEKLGGELRKP